MPFGTGGELIGPSNPSTGGGGGSGTVTSVSVVTANGTSGTVATATTTPAITLKTTVTGILKGNSVTGVISEATAGTDYLAGPLTGDVTTVGEAATLVGTANVIAVVTAILASLGIIFGSGNPNTNDAGGPTAGTENQVYFNATATGNNDWEWRCSVTGTGGSGGTAVWVGKL